MELRLLPRGVQRCASEFSPVNRKSFVRRTVYNTYHALAIAAVLANIYSIVALADGRKKAADDASRSSGADDSTISEYQRDIDFDRCLQQAPPLLASISSAIPIAWK